MLRVALVAGLAATGASAQGDAADLTSLVQTPLVPKVHAEALGHSHGGGGSSFAAMKAQTHDLKQAKRELASLRKDYEKTAKIEAHTIDMQANMAEKLRLDKEREKRKYEEAHKALKREQISYKPSVEVQAQMREEKKATEKHTVFSDLGDKLKKGTMNLLSKAGDGIKQAIAEGQKKAEEEREAKHAARLEAKEKARAEADAVKQQIRAEKEHARMEKIVEEHTKKMARAASQAARHKASLDKKAEKQRLKAEGDSKFNSVKTEEEKMLAKEQEEAWSKAHFAKAEPGKECPEGWDPIVDKDTCLRAHPVVGGVNDVDRLSLSWDNRPSGCFVHNINGHLNFNLQLSSGALNSEDERVCQKQTWGTEQEIAEQQVKVITAEKQVAETVARHAAEQQAAMEAQAAADAARKFAKVQQDKYDDDHVWWKTYKVQVQPGVLAPGAVDPNSEDALAEKRRREAMQGDEQAVEKGMQAAFAAKGGASTAADAPPAATGGATPAAAAEPAAAAASPAPVDKKALNLENFFDS